MRKFIVSSALALSTLFAAGCTHYNALPSYGGAPVYKQIERLSRPAIKEAFESWQNHDQTNRSTPTNDAELQQSIVTFTEAAGRDANHANTLAAILIPDEMQADMSQMVAGCSTANSPCGAYLGIETGGATGSKFGGRWLNDDTIKISLNAIFGSTLSDLGLVADDGKELWCLTDDNLASGGETGGEGTFQSYGNAFPYVNAPY